MNGEVLLVFTHLPLGLLRRWKKLSRTSSVQQGQSLTSR